MLILDRSFDLCAPVTHDYYYQSNVADFKDGFDQNGNVKNEKGKIVILNDEDDYWVKMRNENIIEVFTQVQEEMKNML